MQSAPLINHPCTICHSPTSMWCSRCQSAWYCSPDHLKNDWGRHRRECIPATSSSSYDNATYPLNMIATPPPAEPQLITVSALYFNPEEGVSSRHLPDAWRLSVSEPQERPRIINVNCRPSHKSSQGTCPLPLVQPFFPDGPCEGIILTQGLNGEPLRFPLHLWYSPVCLKEGTPVNRAIHNITSSAAPKAWCGPVIVLKFNGSRRQGYSDAGANDLPALSAYFLAYK